MIASHRSLLLAATAIAALTCTSVARADFIVQPITASASTSPSAPNRTPDQVIDASGLSDGSIVQTDDPVPLTYPTHASGSADTNTWVAPPGDDTIVFDLGQTYHLTGMHIWNYNRSGQSDRDAKDVNVFFSTTSMTDGFTAADSFVFAQAPGEATYRGEDYTLSGTARYVRFDITSNYGGPQFNGLSEVRFIAAAPEPASLALLGLGALAMLPRRRKVTRC